MSALGLEEKTHVGPEVWRPGSDVSSNFNKPCDPGRRQCLGASVYVFFFFKSVK